MGNNQVVSLRNVTKKIGGKTIIDQLSFDIPSGEVFGLLGPNGAGKTTTIRMMVGLMSITNGEIHIEGADVARNFEQAVRHVGAIVENPEMYKFLTGYQNLLHFSRMIPGITHERIQEVITLVNLENRIHNKVKTYSLGMRQRLGVAQALLHKPSLLILDEPTNGLDPAGIRELRDYLRKLAREEGTTVLVSSHLLSEMELMCDRVAIIQNGKLIDVRQIHDYTTNIGNLVSFVFEINDPIRAAEVVTAYLQSLIQVDEKEDQPVVDEVQIVEGGLQVLTVREHIPELNAKLVSEGFKIFGIKQQSKSLEDTFLEITGGEGIV